MADKRPTLEDFYEAIRNPRGCCGDHDHEIMDRLIAAASGEDRVVGEG